MGFFKKLFGGKEEQLNAVSPLTGKVIDITNVRYEKRHQRHAIHI